MTEPAFKKYTDLIQSGTDLLQLMRDQKTEIGEWLKGVSEADSLLLHSPYTWTLREVINHLSDCERVFAFRALWIARGGAMPLVSFDENEFALRSGAKAISIVPLASEFLAVRNSTIAFFEDLPMESWSCVGQVIGHDVTVEKQATILVGHVAYHWKIVKQRFAID